MMVELVEQTVGGHRRVFHTFSVQAGREMDREYMQSEIEQRVNVRQAWSSARVAIRAYTAHGPTWAAWAYTALPTGPGQAALLRLGRIDVMRGDALYELDAAAVQVVGECEVYTPDIEGVAVLSLPGITRTFLRVDLSRSGLTACCYRLDSGECVGAIRWHHLVAR